MVQAFYNRLLKTKVKSNQTKKKLQSGDSPTQPYFSQVKTWTKNFIGVCVCLCLFYQVVTYYVTQHALKTVEGKSKTKASSK